MQYIRDPMRGSAAKSAIANKLAWNWSYLRLQFGHFPHEPDIMTLPSPSQSCRPKEGACGPTHGHMRGHHPGRDTWTG